METSEQRVVGQPSGIRGVGKTAGKISPGPLRCRPKFLRFFPSGFRDETYIAWERGYKWEAHEQWNQLLNKPTHRDQSSRDLRGKPMPNFLEFAAVVRRDQRDLRPRDMIEIQSFMWVLGSDEYRSELDSYYEIHADQALEL